MMKVRRMMMMAGGLMMTTASAMAQSVNLDIGTAVVGASGMGAPTSAFGAAPPQAGFWNNIEGITATTLNLQSLTNTATTAVVTRSTAAGGNFANANANTSGDSALLLNDGHDLSATPGIPITYTFSNLQAGNYDVYTYAVAPDVAAGTDVTNVTISGNTQSVTGPIPAGNNYVLGITYAKHTVNGVAANGSIVISCVRGNATSFGTVNGIQLKKQGASACVPDIAPPGGNGVVNVDDLLLVINSWGACPVPCPPSCAADIAPAGGNCQVNVDDLLVVINGWGPCPGATGACCVSGNCQILSQAGCTSANDSYFGDGSTCTAGICQGACCNTATGCQNLTQPQCTSANGQFQGIGTNCATATCPLANDSCSTPTNIGVGNTGVINWNNATATDDGPPIPGTITCNIFGDLSIAKDIWFKWTAGPDADGIVRVQTCTDPGFDNKMAMYVLQPCPVTADPVGCADDAPICVIQSRAAFDVNIVPGTMYLIRVGSYNGAGPSGPGTLEILNNNP